jgi:hypothetical protein
MRRSATLLILMVVSIALPVAASAIPIAHLMLQSQPGDPIGGGGTFGITYTPQNSQFFVALAFFSIGPPPGVPTFTEFLLGTVRSGSDNTFTTLNFGTDKLGIPLQPGFYPNAERAAVASPGHPGLDVTFRNLGCNLLTGSFTLDHVTFSGTSTIQTFGATFEQHCEGFTPALFGTFTYDASSSVPDPSSLLLLVSGLGVLWGVAWKRRRRKSLALLQCPVLGAAKNRLDGGASR